MNYEAFFGLWLNRLEILYQRIYTVYVGTQYANTYDDIPAALWLAIADNEASAFELWSTTNNNRSQAKRGPIPPPANPFG